MTDSDPHFFHENNVICSNLRNSESDRSNHVVWTRARFSSGPDPIPCYSLMISGHTRVRHFVQHTRHRLLILRVNCHLAAMTDLVILELLIWITFHNTKSFQNPIAFFIPTLSNHLQKFQSQGGTSLFVSFLIPERLVLIWSVDMSSRYMNWEEKCSQRSRDTFYVSIVQKLRFL